MKSKREERRNEHCEREEKVKRKKLGTLNELKKVESKRELKLGE